MMLYFDSSALVAVYATATHSARIHAAASSIA